MIVGVMRKNEHYLSIYSWGARYMDVHLNHICICFITIFCLKFNRSTNIGVSIPPKIYGLCKIVNYGTANVPTFHTLHFEELGLDTVREVTTYLGGKLLC